MSVKDTWIKTLLISSLLFTANNAFASRNLEDFTTYTEVDVPADRISVTSTKVTVTDADRDENCYDYKDYGSNYFNGNFEHWMTVSTATNALYEGFVYALTNQISAFNSWTNGIYLSVDNGNTIYLTELYNSSVYNDGFAYTNNQILYIVVIRDENIGTNGTIYAYIYSDATHLSLLDTLAVTLHSKADFQYVYSVACANDGISGRDWDGYIENLSLSETSSTPTPSSGVTASASYSDINTFTFSVLGVFSALALAFILLKFTKTI